MKISNGAQVTFSYTLLEEQSVPKNVITAVVGKSQILESVDNCLIGMGVGEEKMIEISSEDISSLSLREQGCRKAHLLIQVLEIINVPERSNALMEYLSSCSSSISKLGFLQAVSKGPLKIEKSFDVIEAKSIGQQHYILNTISSEKLAYLLKSKLGSKSEIDLNIFKFFLYKVIIQNHICNPFTRSLIDIQPKGLDISYKIPIWPKSQHKLSFIPNILRLAVHTKSSIVVIFDHVDDWPQHANPDFENENKYLTVGDVTLDMVVESECKDSNGHVSLSWIYTNDGSHPFKTVSESRQSDPTAGYKLALLRCANWARDGSLPPSNQMSGFWSLYRSRLYVTISPYLSSMDRSFRACKEAADSRHNPSTSAASPSDPPKKPVVMVVDTWAELSGVLSSVESGATVDGDKETAYWGVGNRAGTFLVTDIGIRRCVAVDGVNISISEPSHDYAGTSEAPTGSVAMASRDANREVTQPLLNSVTADNIAGEMESKFKRDPELQLDVMNALPGSSNKNIRDKSVYDNTPQVDAEVIQKGAKDEDIIDCDDDNDDDRHGEEDNSIEEETAAERKEREKSAAMLQMFGGMMLNDTRGWSQNPEVNPVHHDSDSGVYASAEIREAAILSQKRSFRLHAASLAKELQHDVSKLQAKRSLHRRLQERKQKKDSNEHENIQSLPVPPPSQQPRLSVLEKEQVMEAAERITTSERDIVGLLMHTAPPIPPSIIKNPRAREGEEAEARKNRGITGSSDQSRTPLKAAADGVEEGDAVESIEDFLFCDEQSAIDEMRRGEVNVCRGYWEVVRCSPDLCITQTQYKYAYKTICKFVRDNLEFQNLS